MSTSAPPDGSAAPRPRGDTTLYLTADGLSTVPPDTPAPADTTEDANDVRVEEAVDPAPIPKDEE